MEAGPPFCVNVHLSAHGCVAGLVVVHTAGMWLWEGLHILLQGSGRGVTRASLNALEWKRIKLSVGPDNNICRCRGNIWARERMGNEIIMAPEGTDAKWVTSDTEMHHSSQDPVLAALKPSLKAPWTQMCILKYPSWGEVPLPLAHPDGKAIFHSDFQPEGLIALLRLAALSDRASLQQKGKSLVFGHSMSSRKETWVLNRSYQETEDAPLSLGLYSSI